MVSPGFFVSFWLCRLIAGWSIVARMP